MELKLSACKTGTLLKEPSPKVLSVIFFNIKEFISRESSLISCHHSSMLPLTAGRLILHAVRDWRQLLCPRIMHSPTKAWINYTLLIEGRDDHIWFSALSKPLVSAEGTRDHKTLWWSPIEMANTLDLQNKTENREFLVIGTLFRMLQKYKEHALRKKILHQLKYWEIHSWSPCIISFLEAISFRSLD